MAASDPTTDVPTPTGTLQGVAAFSWDGTNWQPTGRAGPSVATPTGVLRGVAAFNGGPTWQPAGRAQPGVTTPSGTLDGVAVYTWSGSAWTPPGGTPTPSTPSGALRGVAAFNWDGSAWQPAAQAGPSVATPYGVLDGVAMFGWTGSAWAATGAPSLSLDFMTPGTLDPRITFTRASTATYFDRTGTMQTAAVNAPRWDYNPTTLTLRGLLIEEARTNLMLQSGTLSPPWVSAGGGGASNPVLGGSPITAPDGVTVVSLVAYPAVSGAGVFANIEQPITATATAYSFSVWLRGLVGGEQVWLNVTPDGVTFYRAPCTLTTAWQRFVLNTGTLTAATWYCQIGVDLRDASQTAKPAQSIYIWGAQFEQGAFPTSYIPTTGAAVTRALDQCFIAPANMAPWFASPGGSWFAEFINLDPLADRSPRIIGIHDATGITPLWENTSFNIGTYDGANVGTFVSISPGAITKGASTWAPGNGTVCLNGTAVISGSMTTGFATLATSGIGIMGGNPGVLNEAMTGYIRRVSYWPRVLTNAEMQAVTT